jgi:phospholipid/cholesterol/gamma-HCH transport system substrate-binding protein
MKRRHEVLVGLLVLVAAAVGVVGTIWVARGGLKSGYSLYARFPWGAGLKKGQSVMLAGVQVGYLKNVTLDPNGTVVAEMAIEEEFGVPVRSTATVVPVGIFGDQSIALTPEAPSTTYLPAGDTLPVGRGAPGTAELLARMDTIGRTVQQITDAFQVQLVEDGGIADLRKTLAATNQLVLQLNAVATEQSRNLTTTMSSLQRSASALDSAVIDSTMRNLRATSANAERLTADLSLTTRRLNAVMTKVDSGGGTAARLLNDPGLYDDLRGLVTRLDSLSADLQKNPKKYINLRIF